MRRIRAIGRDLAAVGEVVTCDHIIAEAAKHQSIEGHMYAIVLFDLFSRFMFAYPALTKTGAETLTAVQHYRGRNGINYMYSDGSGDIDLTCRLDGIQHDTCMPGDKQGNGIAERQVQEVKLLTASNLAQAGLSHPYWAYAMRHSSIAWNTTKHGNM